MRRQLLVLKPNENHWRFDESSTFHAVSFSQQQFDPAEVSYLLNQPLSTLDSPNAESEKPQKRLTAFNLFFRDEREKIRTFIKARGGTKQANNNLSFLQMARTISSRWKTISESERNYYQSLENQDKQRFESEMKVWHQQIEQERIKHAGFDVLADPTDLPESLDSIFDEDTTVETIDTTTGYERNVTVQRPQLSTSLFESIIEESRLVCRNSVPTEAAMVSDTESDDEIGRKRTSMEKVYGDMPFTLLGDIGDDAPWPLWRKKKKKTKSKLVFPVGSSRVHESFSPQDYFRTCKWTSHIKRKGETFFRIQ